MLAGCGEKTDPIVGKWILKEAQLGEMKLPADSIGMEFYVEFTKDGKFTMADETEGDQVGDDATAKTVGEWKAEKKAGKYKLTAEDDEPVKVSINKDGQLIMEEEGVKMVFEKKESKKK